MISNSQKIASLTKLGWGHNAAANDGSELINNISNLCPLLQTSETIAIQAVSKQKLTVLLQSSLPQQSKIHVLNQIILQDFKTSTVLKKRKCNGEIQSEMIQIFTRSKDLKTIKSKKQSCILTAIASISNISSTPIDPKTSRYQSVINIRKVVKPLVHTCSDSPAIVGHVNCTMKKKADKTILFVAQIVSRKGFMRICHQTLKGCFGDEIKE